MYHKYQLKPNGLDWSNLLKLGDHIKQVAVDNNKDGSLSLFFIGLDNKWTTNTS